MSAKEATSVEASGEEDLNTKLDAPMDLPASQSSTPADQTSQTAATSKKPKTPRSRKSDQKPDPTRQKQISLFARRHRFILEQSLGTYTTTQRRAFERDVYDFARALGFSKARAKASMLVARTFCGEEAYDTDDTRLDDEEIDDSCEVLVSLPLSTARQASSSSFDRSFSASSPSIPWSGHPGRTGTDIMSSVEVRETPQSEVGKSKRGRKRVGNSSTASNGKRRKTDSELPLVTSDYNNGDASAGARVSESMALRTSDTDKRLEEVPDVPSQHQVNGDGATETKTLEHQISISTGGEPAASREQVDSHQLGSEGQQDSQKDLLKKKAKGKKQQSRPNVPPKTPNKSKAKRKGQQDGPQEQSAATSARTTHTATDGLNGIGNRGAVKETALKPPNENAKANGISAIETAKRSQAQEPSGLLTPEPQEETQRGDAKQPLDGEKTLSRETKKENFDRFMEELKVLEAEKKTRKEELKVLEAEKRTRKEENLSSSKKEAPKSQGKKTVERVVKQEGDDDFRVRAQELLRTQNEARRAREEKTKSEEVDGGRDHSSEFNRVEKTTVEKNGPEEEGTIRGHILHPGRFGKGFSQSDDSVSVTATDEGVPLPETIDRGSLVHLETASINEAQPLPSDMNSPKEDVIPERPSTPNQQQTSSTASSPLSSLPSTPPWPTPSRNPIRPEEEEKKPKSKRRQIRSKPIDSTLTPTKPLKKHSSKISPYFPSSPKPKRSPISCIPFPPLSSTTFGLVQESLASNPFHLLIAVIFLNKTRGSVALPVFYTFIARFPDPESLASASLPAVVEFFQNLGLQNQRAKK
ncbi:MAG: hypothetical protein Q9168_008304, partial [Polycauliona sp. 1 TL-2023]